MGVFWGPGIAIEISHDISESILIAKECIAINEYVPAKTTLEQETHVETFVIYTSGKAQYLVRFGEFAGVCAVIVIYDVVIIDILIPDISRLSCSESGL